jgi:hypothetical protein
MFALFGKSPLTRRLPFAAAILAMSFVGSASAAQSAEAQSPPRVKRANAFLGIHFDFHAGADCTEVGKHTTPAMVENIIDLVHPDYLQCDCKGHPGFSSYPTKVGNQAPGIIGDPLRVWRQATAARGVSLYMHYSGVWDSEAIRKHPAWGCIDAHGKTNGNATSPFSPYDNELLIPQLRELAGVYGVDGVWVDGECWAAVPDYGAAALKAFRDATGIANVPRSPRDPHWSEFLEFNREAFRNHLRHYIAEVKKTNPNFEMCSNWAFSDEMPEPVSAPVDFLSGDFSPENSVNSARISARYLAEQGKPWDLMAWSFTHHPGKARTQSTQKTAVQLEREAAVVLALGGGFQAYFKQKRDGSITPEQMPVMAEVAKFCRARQAICHHAVAVPQVALLYSTAAHYRKLNRLFATDSPPMIGTLQALLESRQSVEIVSEHHLTGRMASYPLIIVAEWEYLEPKFKDELVAYVKAGGNLLLIGPRTAEMFAKELDVTLQGKPRPNGPIHLSFSPTVFNSYNEVKATTKGEWQAATLGANTKPFGKLHETVDLASASRPAASLTQVGRGHIAATYFTFSDGYANRATRNNVARFFLEDLVQQLFPRPLVEIGGSKDVDVCVARNHGKLLVNLVNTSGPHEHEPILESIPPVGPLGVAIRQAAAPKKVTLEPGGRPLEVFCRDGQIHVTVPRVDIHEIVVVEGP